VSQPIDHEARRRASEDLRSAFALTAGAGTGKTRTLVTRLVRLLEAGVPPARIAVVTFTEAATQELRARVRRALDQRLAEAAEAERPRWLALLGGLERLTVATLHAFALELLRAEALDAGFAPDVEVDPVAASAALDAALRRLRSDWTSEEAVALSERVTPTALSKAARLALARRELAPEVLVGEVEWATLGAEGERWAAALVAEARQCKAPGECKLYGKLDGLLLDLGRRPSTPAALAGFLAELQLPAPDARAGKAEHWPGGSKARLVEAWRGLVAHKAALVEARSLPLHRQVVQALFQKVIPWVSEARAEAGHADFDDLLFRAAALLAREPAARRRLAARYDHLLVDEVQDTDPLQAELVARLMDPEGEASRWTELRSPAAGLFVVGDPKQSIYRFRRADVGTWRALSAWIQGAGQAASLAQAFRSVPDILTLVNHLFQAMPDYEPLIPHRGPAHLEPVVVLDAADPEAAVAAHVQALLAAGAQVVDPETGAARPLHAGDVMVLLPAWTRAPSVQDALTKVGLPAVIEGGRRFFERDEVRLAIAALRAVDEPDDRAATVFALRGLFGHTHEALARHVTLGGRWACTVPAPAGSPCEASLRLLGALHRRRDGRPWGAILQDILHETRADAVWALRPDGAAALANLDKLRALILQLEEGAGAPSEVVERLQRLAETSGEEDDLPVRDPEAQAVRITTYFKAKGREAPVVVLLHADRRQEPVEAVVDRAAGTVALKVGDLLPPGWEAREAQERAEVAAERLRWMYVAMTRARDQMVVVRPDSGKANLLPDGLQSALGPPRAERDEVVEVGGARVRVRWVPAEAPGARARGRGSFGALDPEVDAALAAPVTSAQAEAWGPRRRESIMAARRAGARWVTVSQLVQPRRAERSGIGARAGQVVHRVMEALDLSEPAEALLAALPGWLDVFAPQAGLHEDERRAAHEVLERLLAHEVIGRARVAPERWTETPFAYPERGRVVTGVIDLCFPLDAERRQWVVVDYKSDTPGPDSPVRAAYKAQLRHYAQAILRNAVHAEVEVVEEVLAEPGPAAQQPPRAAALAEVTTELAEGLEGLLDAGAEVPLVDPPLVEDAVVELWFAEAKVALLVGQPSTVADALRAQGVTVVAVDDAASGWAEEAVAGLTAALGLAVAQEEVGGEAVDDEAPE
jgi:ATP-dependent helicase/nuclease subunit A